jgi:hypothetical protein
MTQEEFILKNITADLIKSGYSESDAERLSSEGLRFWRESAHFNKSAYADTLRHVKRISKSLKK